jgi:hypothetical protein
VDSFNAWVFVSDSIKHWEKKGPNGSWIMTPKSDTPQKDVGFVFPEV